MSLIAQLDPSVFSAVTAASPLVAKYATDMDPDSAREALARINPVRRTS